MDDDRHYPHRETRVLAHGELLVTGHGEVVLEERLRRSRALFVHSIEAVEVRFKEDEPPCPPCNPDRPDDVDWEAHERHHDRELLLKIKWHVSCARTIVWRIHEVG